MEDKIQNKKTVETVERVKVLENNPLTTLEEERQKELDELIEKSLEEFKQVYKNLK